MITFLASSPEFSKDETTRRVWSWIEYKLEDEDGVCYYKHPVVRATSGVIPELTLVFRKCHPVAIRCLPFNLDDIQAVEEDRWIISNQEIIDSPLLEVDDFVIGLKSRFDKERSLRRRINPFAVIAMPIISKADFEKKFPHVLDTTPVIWADGDVSVVRSPLSEEITESEWRIVRSILQGVRPLRQTSYGFANRATTLGAALRELENQIALLDIEQEKASIQIAPGPQRIRGLAGTGKTVLLAMKAANIHLRYPDSKILFTFNTQSLYNQTKKLITRFYRFYSDVDPDWDNLHVRHAWGGRNRPGVYFDLCSRLGVPPLSLDAAKQKAYRKAPFQICCEMALQYPIQAEYDFILVDEAQDFPKEYFQVLYKLSNHPHQIYWAYDELQSLSSLEIQKPEELFGKDDKGNPLVTLEGDDYPGGIEKDLILHKSYRCPHKVLLLAHAIGLGIYSKDGCVQMLENRESWEAIGYEVESGELKTGKDVVIYRPPENSPNIISEIYEGDEQLIECKVFGDRLSELQWIADSISRVIEEEDVPPDQIVVISMDSVHVRRDFAKLQGLLFDRGIVSSIPGLIDDTAAYAESGKVTLSTIYRAKGNEAAVVYIMAFEAFYDYVEPVEGRNKAFTAISRSKAWVRITGIGSIMEDARGEILRIMEDYPRFRFVFPDMEDIRGLDAETGKRRREIQKAKSSASELLKLDPQALSALAKTNPEMFDDLLRRIEEIKRENK